MSWSTVCPGVAYNDAPEIARILTIVSYNESICDDVFHAIINDEVSRLNNLLPVTNHAMHSSRQ